MIEVSRLRAIPVLAGLGEDELDRLAAFALEESYAPGTVLLREGDFAIDLYLVESGTADIVRRGERIATVGPGDIVGEIGIVEKQQRTADVIASSALTVIKASHWEITRLPRATRDKFAELAGQRRDEDARRP